MTTVTAPAEPHFGVIHIGGHRFEVHKHTLDHMPDDTAYQRFNKRLAIWITAHVGTMTCFWIFNLLSVLSLPATLVLATVFHAPKSGFMAFILGYGFIFLIQWVCQNWIQLILLPALMVGQNLQNQAADSRNALLITTVNQVADWMNLQTQGGLTEVMAVVRLVASKVGIEEAQVTEALLAIGQAPAAEAVQGP